MEENEEKAIQSNICQTRGKIRVVISSVQSTMIYMVIVVSHILLCLPSESCSQGEKVEAVSLSKERSASGLIDIYFDCVLVSFPIF